MNTATSANDFHGHATTWRMTFSSSPFLSSAYCS